MKYSTITAVISLAIPHVSAQGWGPWAPSCLADCANAAASGGELDDFCRNDDGRLATANQCISDSSCSTDEKNAAYSAISQLCLNAGAAITASTFPQATHTTLTSNVPLPTWTTGYYGPGRHGPWGGPNGPGPWGTGNWGPWSTNSAWRTGPWTAWWGGSACPSSDWAGWTSGSWSTNAAWTNWRGCSCETTGTTVVTTTVSGSVRTTTSYGVQVAQVTGTEASTGSGSGATGSITPVETSGGASRPLKTGMPIAVGAVMGLMGVL